MGKIHVLRRDPSVTDGHRDGINLGDVAINLLTGARWFLANEGAGWLQVPVAGGGGGGGDYTGPLDLVAGAVVAYGQRAMSAAARGSAVYTIRRGSDDTEQAFSSDATTGAVDAAAVSAFLGSHKAAQTGVITNGGSGYDDGVTPSTFDVTLVGGTGTATVFNVTTDGAGVVSFLNSITTFGNYSAVPANPTSATGDDGVNHGTGLTLAVDYVSGFVSQWKDQSGNANDATQATASTQPAWVSDQLNGAPSFQGTLNIPSLGLPSALYSNGAVTFFIVARYGAGNLFVQDTAPYIDFAPGPGAYVDQYDGTNEAGGTYDDTAFPEDEYTLWECSSKFGATTYLANGTVLTESSSNDGGGPTAPITAAGDLSIGQAAGGDVPAIVEFLCYNSEISAPNRLAIRENIAAAYGITLA